MLCAATALQEHLCNKPSLHRVILVTEMTIKKATTRVQHDVPIVTRYAIGATDSRAAFAHILQCSDLYSFDAYPCKLSSQTFSTLQHVTEVVVN